MKFYTVADLAEMLQLSQSQVYALIEDGLLKCHRFTRGKSGAIRVSQAQLDAYLQATEQGGKQPTHQPTQPPQPETPAPRPVKKGGVDLW
jgi:excisionase family DNA binding protein